MFLACTLHACAVRSGKLMEANHSRPQSPSFLGHVVGKEGLATGRLQIKGQMNQNFDIFYFSSFLVKCV